MTGSEVFESCQSALIFFKQTIAVILPRVFYRTFLKGGFTHSSIQFWIKGKPNHGISYVLGISAANDETFEAITD